MAESPQYAWDRRVALLVHPTKVAILEAFTWIGEPLSPKLIDEVLDRKLGVSLVAYHMRKLADSGLLDQTHQSLSNGPLQTFYRVLEDPAS
ncbi:MAG TPA: helix-turn-helix domain-containing protein [Terrimicrobiaceae bacterium]|nr:helix-turn-helix domain-containing protein [Terrimicrobiaceae bacterium]